MAQVYRVRLTSPVDRGYHHLSPPLVGLENAQRYAARAQQNAPQWTVVVEIVSEQSQ